MTRPRAVVIGIGNEYRRDDAIGVIAARELDKLAIPGVRVTVCDGEPTRLLDSWADTDLAIVIDAVLCQPSDPGRIRRTSIQTLTGVTATSSHTLGLRDAIPLGRALDRLPRELVVITVEAENLGPGPGLSAPVEAAVPAVLDTVRQILTSTGHSET
ncbi:hydrogenase maturation protease [Nocardia miyunensis]|uniref:hydrogenase maturation protease n=1 Tax=Nocardia miyunensis TaxID=282684 RepID=UPI0008343019|nr:hydrogenase maturation protease [Nocardia miyunensis]